MSADESRVELVVAKHGFRVGSKHLKNNTVQMRMNVFVSKQWFGPTGAQVLSVRQWLDGRKVTI